MRLLLRVFLSLASVVPSAVAGTVVITSLPDAQHPISPLTSLGGVPLGAGTVVKVGVFPDMTDDEIRDMASIGGFPQVAAAFVIFGEPKAIGDGVNGEAGNFEISARQKTSASASSFGGEEVSLLIQQDGGQEFLIVRFKGKLFELDPDTGIEPLLSLHLADAKVIVGNRFGVKFLSTSPAPVTGGYNNWIAGFPGLTEPEKRLPEADPDGDGRSNFLEYATGGDPDSPADLPPCQLSRDESGVLWIRFSRPNGIGGGHAIEWSPDLVAPWQILDGTIEADPNPSDGGPWMRMCVPQPLGTKGFFRLRAGD